MADVYAGCLLERLPSPRALARVRFFEYAPRPPLPTFATLARMKKQAPSWPEVALVAPRSTWLSAQGAMRPGPELDAGLDWVKRAADILSCTAVVLATGAELSTGGRDRERLANVVERLRATGRTVVVAPRGLWEPEHAEPFAAECGAIYGFDPLEHEAPRGELIYARVRPMGARPRLTDGHLAQIAERITTPEATRTYVALESEQCSREARRLLTHVAEIAGSEPGDGDGDDDDEDGPSSSDQDDDED